MRSKLGTGLYKPGEDAGKEDIAKFLTKAVELSDGKLLLRPDPENEDAMNALFSALGRPAEAGDYEFEELEGATLDDDYKKYMSTMAHKLNLTKAQLKTLDKEMRTERLTREHDAQTGFDSKLNELSQEWGFAFAEREHMAKKVAGAFFPQLKDANFSADELRSFYAISKQFKGSGKEFAEQGDQGDQSITPSEASAKISEIRNNKEHPYNNVQDSGHKLAKQTMRNLYKVKNGLPVD
jgi:hypothetical protein